jgi:hypothetical protein
VSCLVSELVKGLLRFSVCELLLLEAGSWGWYFRNPEEGERLPLEAVTGKLVKTQQAEKI